MAEKKAKTVTVEKDSNKLKALETAVANIEKRFGKGAVMKLGENINMNVEHIKTGSLSLDMALGIGGVPKGRIVEIYGPESSGKTTLALQIVAESQKQGGCAAFIDVEHALDPAYAKNLGVDIDSLLVSQPDTGEQALEIAEALICSGAVDVIIVDSVAALVPKAEIEGEMGDSHVGLQARLMSQSLRKLTGALSKSKCTAIFINQLRDKIGVFYGPSETTTGGRALKFFASVRIDIRRVEAIKVNGEVVGNRTKAKVVKNKMAPPFKEAEFDIMYGKGISREGELIDIGLTTGVLSRSGAWFYYGEDRIGQGKDNVRALFASDKALADEIEAKIVAKIQAENEKGVEEPGSVPGVAPTTEEADNEPVVRPRKKVNIDIAVDE